MGTPGVQLTAMQIKPPGAVIVVGKSKRLLSQLIGDGGLAFNVTSTATWTSSDPTVARSDGDGQIVAVAPGTVMVTAARDGQSGTALVKIIAAPISTLEVTPATVTLGMGGT